jgi:hypothetical protein
MRRFQAEAPAWWRLPVNVRIANQTFLRCVLELLLRGNGVNAHLETHLVFVQLLVFVGIGVPGFELDQRNARRVVPGTMSMAPEIIAPPVPSS